MPLIEELPLSTTRTAQPGWAYVPDLSAASSSLPLLPASSSSATAQAPNRKRARLGPSKTDASSAYAHASSKQQKATDARLKDLDRENFREANVGSVIAVPKVEGLVTPSAAGGAGAAAGGGLAPKTGNKKTSNVRRILGYNRNFGHYLADEEALIAAGGGGFQGTWGAGVSTSSSGGAGGGGGQAQLVSAARGGDGGGAAKRRSEVGSTATATTTASAPATGAREKTRGKTASASTSTKAKAKAKAQEQEQEQEQAKDETPVTVKTETSGTLDGKTDVHMSGTADAPPTDHPHPNQPPPSPSTTLQPHPSRLPPPPPPRYDPSLDRDPLLRTLNTLPKPSERVIAALLAEPPLSYNAARATTASTATLDTDNHPQPPRRWFCAVCGYWGKVRCRKCGGRCCGLLECWREHPCEP